MADAISHCIHRFELSVTHWRPRLLSERLMVDVFRVSHNLGIALELCHVRHLADISSIVTSDSAAVCACIQ